MSSRSAAVLLALLLCSAAAAEPGGPGPPRRDPQGAFIERHAERLGLDDATLEKIREVVDASRVAAARRRDEKEAAHDRMLALLAADAPEAAQVMAQADEIGAIELAERKARLLALLAIRSLLDDEQRAELVRMREEHRGRMHRGHAGLCSRDLERLCSEVAPGRATLRCLDGGWDELSPACRTLFETPLRDPPLGGSGS